MRVIFVFLFLLIALTAADNYDDVKAKIQDLIDDGFGKYNKRGSSSSKKSVSDEDSYSQEKKKKMKSMDWPSDDSFEDDGDDYEIRSYKESKRDNNRDQDDSQSSNSRSRSVDSDSYSDSGSSSSKSSSKSESSSDVKASKGYYKNGKKKGVIGKLFDKVATKLKSIPGKFAAGAALLSGKVVSGVASIPGKVVDGVKSIPSAAKSILPGGNKKNGDITLNDYTQDSSEQENHFHVHKDKHYHDERHRHQDDSSNLNVYNNWDGDDLNEKYGSIYDNLRFKRSAERTKARFTRRPVQQLHKKPSERKQALILF